MVINVAGIAEMFWLPRLLMIYSAFDLHSWTQIKYLQGHGKKNVGSGVARVIQYRARRSKDGYTNMQSWLLFLIN